MCRWEMNQQCAQSMMTRNIFELKKNVLEVWKSFKKALNQALSIYISNWFQCDNLKFVKTNSVHSMMAGLDGGQKTKYSEFKNLKSIKIISKQLWILYQILLTYLKFVKTNSVHSTLRSVARAHTRVAIATAKALLDELCP